MGGGGRGAFKGSLGIVVPPRPLILSSKDKFLISLLCFRQETLFLVSLAAVLWMGERMDGGADGWGSVA